MPDHRTDTIGLVAIIPRDVYRAPDDSPTTSAVRKLEHDHGLAMGLLGEIVATFSIERNRTEFAGWPNGKRLLEIADRWKRRYETIGGPQ